MYTMKQNEKFWKKTEKSEKYKKSIKWIIAEEKKKKRFFTWLEESASQAFGSPES